MQERNQQQFQDPKPKGDTATKEWLARVQRRNPGRTGK